MSEALILVALYPIYRLDIMLRSFGLARDEMHWSDRLAINHGSLDTDWFYA